MKKTRFKIAVLALVVMLLCIGYFVAPVRPAIAAWAANQYIQRHYQQYDLPPADIVAIGYRDFYCFRWITEYGAQSLGSNGYSAFVACNGWLPFIVQESFLWEGQDLIPTDP